MEFNQFWSAYPKKRSKADAKKAWIKQNGLRPPIETILAKISELKKSNDWIKENGQFIPHPATWLNRGGWDDEVKIETVSKSRPPTFAEIEAQRSQHAKQP